MVKKPWTGNALDATRDGLDTFPLAFGEDTLDFLVAASGFEKGEMRAAGRIRSKLSSAGADEYAVVAKRIAPTLSKKSVKNAAGPYGTKKFRRDWRADQSKTAAWNDQKSRQKMHESILERPK